MTNHTGRSRLAALAGVLVVALAVALAAARPRPTTALIINPAANDFGQVIVGARGTLFMFIITVPPGAGATDDLSSHFSGSSPLDFPVSPLVMSPSAGSTVKRCGAPGALQSGSCYLWVEFVPVAMGARRANLQLQDTRGNSGITTLTGTGIFGCAMYEALCNYGGAYSGTVSWSGALAIQQGGRSGTWTSEMTVSVVNGVATCQGTKAEKEQEFTGSRLDRSRKADGIASGPGIFTVEFKKQDGQLVYQITVVCPTARVTETNTNYLTNETGTGTSQSKPADWRDRNSLDPEPAGTIGMNLLSGQKTIPHPDEDPGNGVTGTMTFKWSLKRN